MNILPSWDDLLLIESEVGNSVHRVLARWPLLPPAQGLLPFDSPPPSLSAQAAKHAAERTG